jgi:tetratricopeptide (TPR) repeat protein
MAEGPEKEAARPVPPGSSDTGDLDGPGDSSSLPAQDADQHKGSRLLNNRYKKIRVAFSARKSTVYRSLDASTGDIVAVKEMSDRFSSDYDRQVAEKAFFEEARRLQKLNHPGLPRVIDYFREEDKYYLVTSHFEGETLETRMKNRGSRPYEQKLILSWTGQILEALGYLHGQSPPIIYRCLRPSSVLVEDGDTARLIDFDIDRLFSPKKEAARGRGGPGFEAPETQKGFADCRSDLFSLGMLIRYLFSGLNPDDASRFTRFKRIRDVNNDVSPWLDELVFQMVDPSAQSRPASVEQVMEVIETRCREPEQEAPAPGPSHDGDTSSLKESPPAPGPQPPPSTVPLQPQAAAPGVVPSQPAPVQAGAKGGVSREWALLSMIFLVPVAILAIMAGVLAYPHAMAYYYGHQGRQAFRTGNFGQAAVFLQKSHSFKNDTGILELLADCNMETGSYQDAVKNYTLLLNAVPAKSRHFGVRLGQAHSRLAGEAFEKADYPAASEAFELAIKADPQQEETTDQGLLLSRATAFLNTGKVDRACRDFTRLTAISPRDARAFVGKGQCSIAMGNLREAMAAFEKAKDLDPQYSDMYKKACENQAKLSAQEGQTLVTQRRFEEAIARFEEARKLLGRPDKVLDDAEITAYVELANQKKLQSRYGEAMICMNKALEIDSESPKALIMRADLYYVSQEWDKAIADYEAITALNAEEGLRNFAVARAGAIRAILESKKQEEKKKEELRQQALKAIQEERKRQMAFARPPNARPYFVFGNGSNKAVVAENGGAPLLLDGNNYELQKDSWYHGIIQGDRLKLWVKQYNQEKVFEYGFKKLEILLVDNVSRQTARKGKNYSYVPEKYVIALRKPDNTIIIVEDEYLARQVRQGTRCFADVGLEKVVLYYPGNHYRGDSFNITGSGGIY